MRKFTQTAAALISLSVLFVGTSIAESGNSVGAGTFTGASDHVTTGGVTVFTTPKSGTVVILDTDFSLDGAPDPGVGFGIDGKYDPSSDLGKLKQVNGLQAYVVPDKVKASKYNEVYIWCRKFSVPLGVAKLR